jgi:hypothetical protein
VVAVGCNLGRTAEFTSKIVHTLNLCHVSARLAPAVDALVVAQDTGDLAGSKLAPVAVSRSQGREEARRGGGGEGLQMHAVMWTGEPSEALVVDQVRTVNSSVGK